MQKPFKELTTKQKTIEIIRWILFLPAMFLSPIFAYFIGLYIVSEIFGFGNECAIISGIITVLVTVKIVPRHRRIVAIIFTGHFIVNCIRMYISSVANPSPNNIDEVVMSIGVEYFTIASIGVILGAAWIFYKHRKVKTTP